MDWGSYQGTIWSVNFWDAQSWLGLSIENVKQKEQAAFVGVDDEGKTMRG